VLESDTLRAVLLTGPFGVGKSAVAAEIADVLGGHVAYAAIDLDWLMWYDDGHSAAHSDATTEMLARNLGAVVANYREAGVRLFILAGSVRAADEYRALRAAVGMPVIVVRLHAPLAEIEARLASDVTTGRQDDLRRTRNWIAAGEKSDFEDFAIENVGPIRAVARRVIDLVGMPGVTA
jgi:hypothetical protein